MLRLRTFGGLTLEGAPQGLGGAASQRRPMALLLLLAAAGERGVSRDKLLGLLWPDSDAEHGRSALRQTLYALRRDLGLPELFQGTGDLRLNATLLESDLAAFDAALVAGDREQVVALYQGPLADGFFLSKASEFERWLESERRLRAQQFAAAAVALASEASRAGDHARAVLFWRRAATEDRLSARVAVELMRALAEAGDRAGAIQHARVYEGVIRAELDAAPDPAVGALAEQLRSASGSSETMLRPTDGGEAGRRAASTAERLPADAIPTPASDSSSPAVARRIIPLVAVVAVTIAAATLAGVAVLATRSWKEPALDPTLVAVAPYRVYDAGLALWGEGLMDILARNLDGAGPLRTVTPSASARYWRGGVHRASAREFSRRTHAGIVVFGYLVRAGTDSVRAVTSLIDATSQRTVEVETREAVERMDRLTDSLTVRLLRQLDSWRPIGAVRRTTLSRTTSIEALRAFLRGEQFYRGTAWDSAQVWYERAIAYDSSFALPFQRLGNIYGWQRQASDSLAEAYKLRAGALNHGLGRRDSLLVLADSLDAAGNQTPTLVEEWPLSRRLFAVLTEAVRHYPEDPEIWHAVGEARYHFGFGPVLGVSWRSRLDAFDRAIALDSAFAPAYVHTPELALNVGGPPLARRYIEAYLRLDATARSDESTRLLQYVLAPGGRSSAELARVLDTVPGDVLRATRAALRWWPDSAETALQLSRRLAANPRPGRYGPNPSAAIRANLLARQLAFRGHVREAHRVAAGTNRLVTFELAYLGGASEDSIEARMRRLGRLSHDASLAIAWWAARRDTVALRAILAGARGRAESLEVGHVARLIATYDTAAALAHLALVRADTAEALRRFRALPDTLCVRCHADRLTRAKLLAARGRHREALAALENSLLSGESAFEVLFALERGRAAERLGESESAARSYQFVLDAWQRGDPEVRRYVDEARHGLARIRAQRP